MIIDSGFQANDSIWYALAREHYLALNVYTKILARIKPATDLQQNSTLKGSS